MHVKDTAVRPVAGPVMVLDCWTLLVGACWNGVQSKKGACVLTRVIAAAQTDTIVCAQQLRLMTRSSASACTS